MKIDKYIKEIIDYMKCKNINLNTIVKILYVKNVLDAMKWMQLISTNSETKKRKEICLAELTWNRLNMKWNSI